MLSNWSWILTGVAGAFTSFIAYSNIPMRWMAKPQVATLEWLSNAKLMHITPPFNQIDARELWKENGAVFMAEAQALSDLIPSFSAKGVPLYAVLHEKLGATQFRKYFKGEVFLDPDKKFFGPEERRMLLQGLLRFNVWRNVFRTQAKGVSGNLSGDGTLLGGVFLIGPGETGILYEHREMEFGDKFNETEILAALEKIQPKLVDG